MKTGLALLVAFGLVACAPSPGPESPGRSSGEPSPHAQHRPTSWARPLARPGLPNLHQVAEGYYRGAQPTAEGIGELEKLGVKTIVNLRSAHSDRDLIGSRPLGYEAIHMHAWHAEDEDVVRFLRIATDPSKQPLFVHCQHGADRTGTVTAVYRIVVQGWTKDEAIREMTQGGYGFHPLWYNLVRYIRELDVDRIRREAGLSN
jgi:protein tyrosine/serine phosphatase